MRTVSLALAPPSELPLSPSEILSIRSTVTYEMSCDSGPVIYTIGSVRPDILFWSNFQLKSSPKLVSLKIHRSGLTLTNSSPTLSDNEIITSHICAQISHNYVIIGAWRPIAQYYRGF